VRIPDLLHFSFQSFKNRKSRVILTVLGVAVAIGVIIFLVSLGYGLQKTILERITTADSILTLDVYPPDTESIKLDNNAVNSMKEIENIKVVSPQAVVPGQINMNDLVSETSVNVINTDFFRLAGLEVTTGKNFEDSSNTIIISPTVADLFGIPVNEIVGKKLKLSIYMPKTDENGNASAEVVNLDQEFEIIGIIDSLESTNQIFIRYSDIGNLQFNEYQFIKIQVTNQSQIENVRAKVIEKGYLVSALSDVVEQANQIFWVIQSVLGIFGIFSLFVAAIGLVNTMTISLLERINEIGIMRAIGASAWDIKKIFLIESTVIGFLGGVVGIVIGYIGGFIFTVGLNILASALGGKPINIFYTPLWFIFFVILFSAGVGFLSGILPAQKAGKLNALEALRYK
jgi:putative ABC transport system permease protein